MPRVSVSQDEGVSMRAAMPLDRFSLMRESAGLTPPDPRCNRGASVLPADRKRLLGLVRVNPHIRRVVDGATELFPG